MATLETFGVAQPHGEHASIQRVQTNDIIMIIIIIIIQPISSKE